MKVLFVNLTPHEINLPDKNIESIGTARLSEEVQEVDIIDNIPVLEVNYKHIALAEDTVRKIDELIEKEEGKLVLVLIVSGIFDRKTSEKLVRNVLTYLSVSNFIKLTEVLVVAPYTGTHAKYIPEREKGIIKKIKAFRLLFRVRMK